mgnify:FL=1
MILKNKTFRNSALIFGEDNRTPMKNPLSKNDGVTVSDFVDVTRTIEDLSDVQILKAYIDFIFDYRLNQDRFLDKYRSFYEPDMSKEEFDKTHRPIFFDTYKPSSL